MAHAYELVKSNKGAPGVDGQGFMEHLSAAKTFKLTERFKFTFRAAANVLNHANFGLPSANISVPGSVATIHALSAAAPTAPSRQIELRGRIEF